MNAAQLKAIVDALESKAGIISTANESEAGQWLRVALAAEKISNTTSTANATVEGYMLRAAKALENTGSTTGAEENPIYRGFLKRIVDALEGKATVSPGSLEHRAQVAAAAAVFNAFASYALALPFKTASTDGYWVGGTRYGTTDPGVEKILDPGFDGLGFWTTDPGITANTGKAIWTASAGSVYRNGLLTVGTRYQLTFTIDSISAGSIGFNQSGATARSAPGTYTETFVATQTYLGIAPSGAGAVNAQIDNVSLKAIGIAGIPGYTFTRSGAIRQEVEAVTNNSLYGPELVNGGDGNSTTGWVNGGTATITSAGGRLRITRNSLGGAGYASQAITTVVGQRYRFRFSSFNGTGTPIVQVGTGAGNGANYLSAPSALLDQEVEFLATVPTTVITIWENSNVVGSTAEYDNISLTTSNLYQYEGAEQLLNPSFDDTSGWEITTSPGTNTFVAGALNCSGSARICGQQNRLTTGKCYTAKITFTGGSSGGLRIGHSAGNIDTSPYYVIWSAIGNSAEPRTLTHTFTATGPHINLGADLQIFTGQILEFSIKELFTDALDDFPTNVPAIVPGVGLWSRGALENKLLHSQDITQAAWLKTSAPTMTPNVAVAPDGIAAADRMTATATAAEFYQSLAVAAQSTSSVFAKFDVGSPFLYAFSQGGTYTAFFNLQTGAVTNGAGGAVGYMVDFGGGWWRCIMVAAGANGNVGWGISRTAALNGATVGDSVLVWQGQQLTGNHPDGGPIIATGATTLSTGADRLSTTHPFNVDQDFVIWGVANLGPAGVDDDAIFNMGSTSANRITAFRTTAGGLNVNSVGGGSSIRAAGGNTPGAGRFVVLNRRRAGKNTTAVKINGVVTIAAESGLVGWANPSSTLEVGSYLGALNADGNVEGVFAKTGTFSDADLTAILEAA